MPPFIVIIFFISALASCSKTTIEPIPPSPIPDIIGGSVTEMNVTPIDINTPDKAYFLIAVNGTSYKVQFNARTGQVKRQLSVCNIFDIGR